MKHPQEIEVWYILPAIRKELAKELINFGLKQKEIAEILDITEPAVSQYFKLKRANEINFSKKIKKNIKEASKRIYQNPGSLVKEVDNICQLVKKEKLRCEVHKKHDKSAKNCCICFKAVKKVKSKKPVIKEKNYVECKLCNSFHKAELCNCPNCGYIRK